MRRGHQQMDGFSRASPALFPLSSICHFPILTLSPSHPLRLCLRNILAAQLRHIDFLYRGFVSSPPGWWWWWEGVLDVISRWFTSTKLNHNNWVTAQTGDAYEKKLRSSGKKIMFCTGRRSIYGKIIFGLCFSTVCLEGGGLLPCSPVKFFASCCGRFVSNRFFCNLGCTNKNFCPKKQTKKEAS